MPAGPDLQGEYVKLVNRGKTDEPLNGWSLCDQQGHHCYTFKIFTLPGQASVRVWPKEGSDTLTDLYWVYRQPVWTNAGDTAFLRDNRGALVDESPCP